MPHEDSARPSDDELMAAVVGRDQSAFAALYDRHVDVLFGSVLRFVGDRRTAEDIVQEAYLAAWQRASLFDRASGTVLGWLLGIARNKAIDRLRSAARRPRVVAPWAASDDDDDPQARFLEAGGRYGFSAQDDPETVADRNWAGAVVRTALAAMPDADRTVLQLAYDDGLTQSEIAARLGWPLGTVKSRTRRALAGLREALEGVPDLRTSSPAGLGGGSAVW